MLLNLLQSKNLLCNTEKWKIKIYKCCSTCSATCWHHFSNAATCRATCYRNILGHNFTMKHGAALETCCSKCCPTCYSLKRCCLNMNQRSKHFVQHISTSERVAQHVSASKCVAQHVSASKHVGNMFLCCNMLPEYVTATCFIVKLRP